MDDLGDLTVDLESINWGDMNKTSIIERSKLLEQKIAGKYPTKEDNISSSSPIILSRGSEPADRETILSLDHTMNKESINFQTSDVQGYNEEDRHNVLYDSLESAWRDFQNTRKREKDLEDLLEKMTEVYSELDPTLSEILLVAWPQLNHKEKIYILEEGCLFKKLPNIDRVAGFIQGCLFRSNNMIKEELERMKAHQQLQDALVNSTISSLTSLLESYQNQMEVSKSFLEKQGQLLSGLEHPVPILTSSSYSSHSPNDGVLVSGKVLYFNADGKLNKPATLDENKDRLTEKFKHFCNMIDRENSQLSEILRAMDPQILSKLYTRADFKPNTKWNDVVELIDEFDE